MTSALNHRYPQVQGELEAELETEDELELEDEFEDEQEWEEESEDEAFLGALGGIARTVGGLLGGDGEFEAEGEAEFEFEFEAEAANEAELEAELEAEVEAELEDETEAFVNPVRRIYRDAELMAHLSRQAAESEDEQESEAFIGALVPLAARLIPRAASLVIRNAPALIRGATMISKTLRRSSGRRRLLQALPVVLQRTAQSLADQAASGGSVTPTTAVRTLTRVAGRVLGDQHTCRGAVDAVGVFDRRYRRRQRMLLQRSRAARNGRPAPAAGLAGGPAYTRTQRSSAPRQQRRRSSAAGRARRNR